MLIPETKNITQSKSKSSPFVSPTPIIQTKLKIGEPDDKYEQEADQMADQVLQMEPMDADPPRPNKIVIQRKCASCEEEKRIRKKTILDQVAPLVQPREATGGTGTMASDGITQRINQSRGGGSSMDGNTKSIMESGFGADFSDVRIHTGANAIQLSRDLNAQAFTVGNNIYFNKGKYQPNIHSGKHLLAHELTHTIQQQGSSNSIQRQNNECPIEEEYGVCYAEEDYPIGEPEENLFTEESSEGVCEAPNELPVFDVEDDQVCYHADHPVTQQSFIGKETNWHAKVKAKWGIRLHTTPITSDYDYVNLNAPAAKVYKRGTNVTVIAEGNKANRGWVKLRMESGQEGWIQKMYVVQFPKDLNFDSLSRIIYYVEKGDNLENLINHKGWYSDYSFSTGNDRRTIVHAFSIMNADNRGIYYEGSYDRSWWKDSVLDRSMEETRKIYQTIRLRQGHFVRIPNKNYIKLLQDKELVGTRSDWKNTSIEIARSVQGFIEGVIYGLGEAILDTVKGLIDLIVSIFTGELFSQAYELVKELWNLGVFGVWEMIKSFFRGVWKKFEDNWNNPNPRQRWFFFGKIVGMLLFEIILALVTGGIGNVIAKSGKVGRVLSKFKSLKKIIDKKKPDLDRSLSKSQRVSLDGIAERRKKVPEDTTEFAPPIKDKSPDSRLDVDDKKTESKVEEKKVVAKSLSRGAQQAQDLNWPEPPGDGYFWVYRRSGKPYLSRTSEVEPKYYDEASGIFRDGNRPVASTAHLPDVSSNFEFDTNTLFNGVKQKSAKGKLGVPGEVRTHRSKSSQRAESSGTGDDAGHLIGDRFGAPGGKENLTRQNRFMNQGGGTYHDLENQWNELLQQGWEIEVEVSDFTRPNETRPFTRKVKWKGKGPNGEIKTVDNIEYVNFETKMSREADGYIPTEKEGELIYLDDYRE